MIKELAFVVPVLQCDMLVLVGGTQEEAYNRLEQKHNVYLERFEEPIEGFRDTDGQLIIVWLRRARDRDTLVHEMVHAATTIMRLKQIKLCEETEEILAYLVEYLVKEVSVGIRRK